MNQTYTYAEARLKAADALTYLTTHIMSLMPVACPGLGTFAVDKYMRLYYDPECLEKWSLEECAAVILHEDIHVVLKHCHRAEATIGKSPTKWQAHVWNLAIDTVVNQMLRECRGKHGGPAVKLPDGGIYPESFDPKLPLNLTPEEYYHRLMDQLDKPEWGDEPYGTVTVVVEGDEGGGDQGEGDKEGQGGGNGQQYSGEQPKPMMGSGGSGGDGLPKPWEQGPPSGKRPGKTEYEQDLLARKVAQAIERQMAKDRGTVPGCWQRFANQVLKPKVDPCRELEAAVKHAIDATYGFGNHTWRKLNRRIPQGGGPLPAHIKPIPRITILVDTSGSMDQSDLAMAMGIIGGVLKGLPTREGLRVVAADTHVQNSQKVFRVDSVELAGGGGTDVGAVIEECARMVPHPDVILAVTDGYTPWPSEPVGPKVVACLTREHNSYPVPEWIKKIIMRVDEE